MHKFHWCSLKMMYELCYMNEFELDLDENLHRYFQHKARHICSAHLRNWNRFYFAKCKLFWLFCQLCCCCCCGCFRLLFGLKSGYMRLHLCLIFALVRHVIVRDLGNRSVAVMLHRASSLLVRPLISVLFSLIFISFLPRGCCCCYGMLFCFFLVKSITSYYHTGLLFIVSVSRNAIWCNPHHPC